MKWNININQFAIVQLGLDIDIIDAAIIDQCVDFSHNPDCERITYNGETYYWFAYSNTLSQIPLLKIKKDAVYRRMKKLADLGLFKPHPNNQERGMAFFAITPLCSKLRYVSKTEPTGLNPYPYGSKPVPPTGLNPDYNSIIDNKNKDNSTAHTEIFTNEENEKWQAFQKWISDEGLEKINLMKKPITQEQFLKLRKECSKEEMVKILSEMANYKPLLTKSDSTYLTFLNWLRRDREKEQRFQDNYKKK
jgi:hypothetical protein